MPDESILGINLSQTLGGKRLRDGGACLLASGNSYSVAEERLSRIKHDGGTRFAVPYVLAQGNLTRPDVVVATSCCEDKPAPWRAQIAANRVLTVGHHLAHAYSAFWPSGYSESLVIVMDCGGNTKAGGLGKWWQHEREQATYYVGSDWSLETIGSDFTEPFAVGFGELFRAATHFLGWQSSTRAGNTMALAALGIAPSVPPIYSSSAGRLTSEMSLNPRDPIGMIDRLLRSRGLDVAARLPGQTISSDHAAVAAFIQENFYEALRTRVSELVNRTGIRSACFAGGVSLNCVAVGRLLDEGVIDRAFVQPASGDTGQSLGAAYAGLHAIGGSGHDAGAFSVYQGRLYESTDVDQAIRDMEFDLDIRGCSLDRAPDAAKSVARLLAGGALVGILDGRSEIGPRALGGRSILADPRSAVVRARLSQLKGREPFMPFAPAVLNEEFSKYFTGRGSETMTIAVKANSRAEREIPAAIHSDHTVRVQRVNSDGSFMRRVLEAFHGATGVGALLNTSFNLANEPMVETPKDALDVFLRSSLDALWIADRLIIKSGASERVGSTRADVAHILV